MTAPDNPLLETMAQAMTDSDIAEMGVCGDPEYYDRQARAVLAAISEAGAVEWGVRWDYISEIYPERTDSKHSREDAQATIDKSFATGSVVTRIAAGPWTAVE